MALSVGEGSVDSGGAAVVTLCPGGLAGSRPTTRYNN